MQEGVPAMMRCNGVNNYWYSGGHRYVVADITAGDVPGSFPVDGTDVDGLSSNDKLAMGTTIYVVQSATVYMAKDDEGTFVAQ
jgi:hypothetical protein